MALILYTYKAQKQLFLVNFRKRDYIYFDCIDEQGRTTGCAMAGFYTIVSFIFWSSKAIQTFLVQ